MMGIKANLLKDIAGKRTQLYQELEIARTVEAYLARLPGAVMTVLDAHFNVVLYSHQPGFGLTHNVNAPNLEGTAVQGLLITLAQCWGQEPSEYGKVEPWAETEWRYLEKYADRGATVKYRKPYLVQVTTCYDNESGIFARRRYKFEWWTTDNLQCLVDVRAGGLYARRSADQERFTYNRVFVNGPFGTAPLNVAEWGFGIDPRT